MVKRPVLRACAPLIMVPIFGAVTAFSAWADSDPNTTITFVRHAQSTANAQNIIDSAPPGANLSAKGQQQAQALATKLSTNGVPYDGIFDSTEVRTQQTAAPLSKALGIPATVMPGLQEIDAGSLNGRSLFATGTLNGQPVRPGPIGYLISLAASAAVSAAWMLGVERVALPNSTDPNGFEFEQRYNTAVNNIYNTGDKDPVVISSGGAITSWTMMNVKNPHPLLAVLDTLGNTKPVVVQGNPQTGWTMVSWGGIPVNQRPNILQKLFVDVRNIAVELQGGSALGDASGVPSAAKTATAAATPVSSKSTATTTADKTTAAAATPASKVDSAISDLIKPVSFAVKLNSAGSPLQGADYKLGALSPASDGAGSKLDALAPKADGAGSKLDALASKTDGAASKLDPFSKADGGASKLDALAPKLDAFEPKADSGASKGGASKLDGLASKTPFFGSSSSGDHSTRGDRSDDVNWASSESEARPRHHSPHHAR